MEDERIVYLNNKITDGDYSIGSMIINYIDDRIFEFKKDYPMEEPKYIKLPLWCYVHIRDNHKTVFRYNKYRKCNLCPTATIEHMHKIEKTRINHLSKNTT